MWCVGAETGFKGGAAVYLIHGLTVCGRVSEEREHFQSQ